MIRGRKREPPGGQSAKCVMRSPTLSEALNLKLRTRRTERSSYPVYERCAAQMLCLRIFALQGWVLRKIDPLLLEERSKQECPSGNPGKRRNHMDFVLWNGCPCGSPVAWIAKWRRKQNKNNSSNTGSQTNMILIAKSSKPSKQAE